MTLHAWPEKKSSREHFQFSCILADSILWKIYCSSISLGEFHISIMNCLGFLIVSKYSFV